MLLSTEFLAFLLLFAIVHIIELFSYIQSVCTHSTVVKCYVHIDKRLHFSAFMGAY